jgi:predicted transcriptional regulator
MMDEIIPYEEWRDAILAKVGPMTDDQVKAFKFFKRWNRLFGISGFDYEKEIEEMMQREYNAQIQIKKLCREKADYWIYHYDRKSLADMELLYKDVEKFTESVIEICNKE